MEYSSDMTQGERDFLNDMSQELTSKINNLIKVNNMEIVKNLHRLNDDVSQKFDQLLEYTNESIRQLCDYRVQERNNLYKNINEIKQNIQAVREGDGKIMEEQERFKKVCF